MRTSTLFWGGILILVGGILLLNNLGVLSFDIWRVFWPLLIILLGVWILLGVVLRRQPQTEVGRVALEGASRGHVRIKHGAGSLRIGAGDAPGMLFEGEFSGGVDVNTRHNADLLEATLRVPQQQWLTPFWWGPGTSLDWDMRLTKEIPLQVDLDTGANEARVDLSDLLVTELNLKSGASSTEITLPATAGFTQARVNTGAASVRINVAQGVALRMRAIAGLGSVNVDRQRFQRHEGYYLSSDYDVAENKIELYIETGVGSVDVR